MKKIIKLTESDLARIVKRVIEENREISLPVRPGGALYTYGDFVRQTLNSVIKISDIPKLKDSNYFTDKSIGQHSKENLDFTKPNQFCSLISGPGYNTILQPRMIENQISAMAVFPPVKYICDATKTYLRLVPINSKDAELIFNAGGTDYRSDVTRHLIKNNI